MSIFPIVNGQKPDVRNVIPPHTPLATVDSEPVMQPVQHGGQQQQDDLIDFGQDDAPAPPVQPHDAKPTQSQGEIAQLLSSTGKPANGPLLDFQDDLRKDLPPAAK